VLLALSGENQAFRFERVLRIIVEPIARSDDVRHEGEICRPNWDAIFLGVSGSCGKRSDSFQAVVALERFTFCGCEAEIPSLCRARRDISDWAVNLPTIGIGYQDTTFSIPPDVPRGRKASAIPS
jgi:hypothetical protein